MKRWQHVGESEQWATLQEYKRRRASHDRFMVKYSEISDQGYDRGVGGAMGMAGEAFEASSSIVYSCFRSEYEIRSL